VFAGGGNPGSKGGIGGGGDGSSGSGVANTGSGGAGGRSSINGWGGAGGSGIVVIAHPAIYTPAVTTTGSPLIYSNGVLTIYQFTSSGTIVF